MFADRPDLIHGISVADASSDPERFANLRGEGCWHLRTLFETGQILIPDGDELTDLRYKVVNSNGTVPLEEKEEVKTAVGPLPDIASSLMLALTEPKTVPTVGCWSLA